MQNDILKRLSEIQLFVLDMDGTLYLGDSPLDGAADFCKKIIESGRKLIYFTNNASKAPEDYVEKLVRLGFPCKRENVMTSGDVAIAYLNEFRRGESVYLLGTENLKKSFAENGVALSDNAKIVVASFDLSLTYEKLERACTLIRNGATFYSTHPDINCPTPNGFIPDSGAICGAIALSTGVKPKYFGKPYAETAQMIELVSGVEKSKTAMVGDRLYTDIALGKNNGLCSILVMSGETTEQMLEDLTENQMPDLKFGSVKEIIPYL